MTYSLWIDPGLNTGVALGWYDALTPYQLLDRWQVHGGVDGFIDWWESTPLEEAVDEIGYEKFVLAEDNDFGADLSGVPIEGVIHLMARRERAQLLEQTRAAKGHLIGYPPEAITKAQRQRVRFDFLEEHGLFLPGTENDDTNDAITHALVSLRHRQHLPTMRRFWPGRRRLQAVS